MNYFIIIKQENINKQQKATSKAQVRLSMKASPKIQKLINDRLQFLQQLFLIRSYQDVLVTNDSKLTQKHEKMEKEQIQTVANILCAVRIDQVFKKQFHRIVLKVFKKIQPSINLRHIASGIYKDILQDYTTFFSELKQKNINDFLKQIFQLQIYNQTTIIYVLLELLIKFLRIKCKTFINQCIVKQKDKANRFDHFSEFMRSGYRRRNSKIQRNVSLNRNNSGSSSKLSQATLQLPSKMQNSVNLNYHKVSYSTTVSLEKQKKIKNPRNFLRSASAKRKQIIHSPRLSQSQSQKRRVIKSYKDTIEQTNQIIQKNANSLNMARQISYSPVRQPVLHRLFTVVFEQQWQMYIDLIGMDEIQTSNYAKRKTTESQNWLKVSQSPGLYSASKKAQWLKKNKYKLIVQACVRNDQIRKQMQNYIQNYKKV